MHIYIEIGIEFDNSIEFSYKRDFRYNKLLLFTTYYNINNINDNSEK